MFAAVFVTPSMTTDGIPTPIENGIAGERPLIRPPSRRARRTVRMIVGTTTSGDDGCGVATRRRGPARSPVAHFHAATLIPLAPNSPPAANCAAIRPASEGIDGDPAVDHQVGSV